MKLSDFIIENKNDSYYAYHDAAKKWSQDTGKPERDFGRAGVDVQDKYIEPEMKKRGLVPDSYMGAGATKYRRESIEDIPCPACGDPNCEHKEEHMEEGTRCWKGYEKKGMKTMFGKRVPNCVKKEGLEEYDYDDDNAFFEDYGWIEDNLEEAEYRGRKVKLNKPMQGDVKKFKVYVKDPKTGNVKKVNFGHGGSSVKGKAMKIRKNNPKARKSFRARHNCDNPGPKTKARYWSCKKW